MDRSVGGSGSCGAVGWARAAGAHRAHELVAIDVDDPLHLEGEEDVEEEHLVTPDDALLLGLRPQPAGPHVLHSLG